jgi:hypothetical protein
VITWQKFQPRAEFNPGQGWNFSPVSAKLKFQPWVKIIPGVERGEKNFQDIKIFSGQKKGSKKFSGLTSVYLRFKTHFP